MSNTKADPITSGNSMIVRTCVVNLVCLVLKCTQNTKVSSLRDKSLCYANDNFVEHTLLRLNIANASACELYRDKFSGSWTTVNLPA